MANNILGWKKTATKTYLYTGIKNNKKTKFKKFINICRFDQARLKIYLESVLGGVGYKTINEKGFLFAQGNVPVLLTAHLDTVHKEPVKDFYEDVKDGKHVISSPQGIGGDDRCGVYIIREIITKTELRPSILFCEDEEIGGVGSDLFCESPYSYLLDDMKFIIELDRANANDAVFYSCDNPEFAQFIEKETGFKRAWGSFSDICNLSPECGIASVNLSTGYYDAHTLGEYVVMEEMLNTAKVVEKLLRRATEDECEQYEYVEKRYSWCEDDFYSAYGYNKNLLGFEIVWDSKDAYEDEVIYFATTESEALGNFFIEHPDICFNDVIDVYQVY